MKKIDISYITINFNSSRHTIKLIESIEKHTSLSYEIIIVDNASQEEDYIFLKNFLINRDNIKLIRSRINSGFASGNMLGVNYACGKYFYFINNDCILQNDCTKIYKEYLDNNLDVALATGKLFDEKRNNSSYTLFPSIIKESLGKTLAQKLYKFPKKKEKILNPTFIEVASGASMFFRVSSFSNIGGFDTTFFLYCEEEDISKRVWKNKEKIIFLPEAEVFHFAGGSSEKKFSMRLEYEISYDYLIQKHFNFFEYFILRFLRIFKIFRKSFKSANNFKLFLNSLVGFKRKDSLKFKQKIVLDDKI